MSFWDTMRGAAHVLGRVMPQCHICGAPGVQICHECQQVGCHRHAYSNAGNARSICSACLASKFEWASDDMCEVPPDDWPYQEMPWEILGIASDASITDINRAHREMSKLHHPDHSGDTERQIAINRAREAMLARAA